MGELVVFPDVVAVVKAAIEARLGEVAGMSGVPVVERVPAERPARFVRLLRTGGFVVDVVIDRAMLTVEAWAPSEQASAALASAVRAVINAMPGGVHGGVAVYRVVEFSGPANSPDPVSRTPRHTWTIEVAVRGSAV